MKPLIIYVDPECPDDECPNVEHPDTECLDDECKDSIEIGYEQE